MFKKIKDKLERLFYALPIQILMIQIRNHKSILLFWIVIFMFISQSLGRDYGIPYLFLEPEYLGEVSFWSMFLLGLGAGAFMESYQIATYILDSYRFPFLALEDSPFFTFWVNNSLIGITFGITYGILFLQFQIEAQGEFSWYMIGLLAGFYLGIISFLIIISAYFLKTNKNIMKVFGAAFVKDLRNPKIILDKAKASLHIRYRVDFFLNTKFRFKDVDKTIPAEFRTMVKVMNQNHGNALFLELMFLLVIVVLGLLEKNPYFQIPSGTSVFLIFSIFLMFLAAFTFWFRKVGLLAVAVGIGLILLFAKTDLFEKVNPAYGIDYSTEAEPYNGNNLKNNTTATIVREDMERTQKILELWKNNILPKTKSGKKPRVIFLCASGGGLRSSYFTFRCLQQLDSLTEGKFLENTRIITGASGGMLGTAYFRELDLLRQDSGYTNIHSPDYAEPISRDLLNRILFKGVTGTFLPGTKVKIGNKTYPRDRGYSFDDQIMVNLPEFKDKRLGDYEQPELSAKTPMMILSPVITNDGRKCYISPVSVSYLCRIPQPGGNMSNGVNGIDFKRFFQDHQPDSLLWPTALRMNASFPLITPYVELPTEPVLKLMDAGVIDNFGIQTAIKFLYVYREWFEKNTEEVLIIQIRDSKKNSVEDDDFSDATRTLLDPFSATYNSISRGKELINEDNLEYSVSWFHGKCSLVRLQYLQKDGDGKKASLSWHLTANEIADIDHSIDRVENQLVFSYIRKWLAENRKDLE